MTLLINSALYISTFYYFYKRNGLIPFTLLWGFYSIIAIFGLYIVSVGLYSSAFLINTREDVDLIPYLLNYYCLLIVSLPLLNIKKIKIRSFKIPSVAYEFLWLLMILFSILSCIYVLELGLYGNMTQVERHEMVINEGNAYSIASTSKALFYLKNIIDIIYKALYPFCIFVIFKSLYNNIIKFRKFVLYLIICFMPLFLSYFITGNRAGFFYLVFDFVFFILLFFNYLSVNQRKYIYFYSSIVGFVILLITYSISEGRYGDSNIGTNLSILRYFGETFPNIGYQYWDKVVHHTYGARQFTDYYSFLFGFKIDYIGFNERFIFWTNYTGVNCAYFKSLFGDLYVEFGTFGALVFSTLLSGIIYLYFKNNKFCFASSGLYFLYYSFCVNMVFDYPLYYTNINGIKRILLMIFVAYILKKLSKRKIDVNSSLNYRLYE